MRCCKASWNTAGVIVGVPLDTRSPRWHRRGGGTSGEPGAGAGGAARPPAPDMMGLMLAMMRRPVWLSVVRTFRSGPPSPGAPPGLPCYSGVSRRFFLSWFPRSAGADCFTCGPRSQCRHRLKRAWPGEAMNRHMAIRVSMKE